ncbi:MAG TPA: CHRD domain-containing protein [Solirubrobacteraceae bacterium]|nr:CHRD domain-containing protein [Solirubrobacteraceae bacterium]
MNRRPHPRRRQGNDGPPVVSLSRGPRLHHDGCVAISPALTQAIWSHPAGYYVNILSARDPHGAVRAQL